MEMRMPDGKLRSEEFENSAALFERFAELSAKGGKVEKISIPQQAADVRREFHQDRSKYRAHQGRREIARRLARMNTGGDAA